MLRRLIAVIAVLAVASIGVLPSQAAAKKKKPDLKGGYTLTLYPDPSEEVLTMRGEGCQNVLPIGVDKRKLSVPAAGKLTVTLSSPDPTGKGVTDWDLYLIDADGVGIDASHGGSSEEQTMTKFKKKATFEVQVCNLVGNTKGTVSWVFQYA